MTLSINAIIWIIGLLSAYSFHLVGEVYISELLLLIVFGMMLKKHGIKLKEPFAKNILFFLLLWFIGQELTDMIRGTDLHDAMRGVAAIFFLAVDFCAVYMLVGNETKRIYIFLVAAALSQISIYFIHPSDYAIGEPWKFGYGSPTIILVFVALTILMKKRMITSLGVLCVLFILGLLSIYLNSRTMGGQVILAGLLFFFSRRKVFYQFFLRTLSPVKIASMMMIFLVLIFGILKTYQWVGDNDVLPKNSQEKYDATKQTFSGPLGMLGFILAGRHEFLASTQAVYDSPIIGHGSWAKDMKYRLFLYQMNADLGTDFSDARLDNMVSRSELIPAHSHIMQAWVWAGILGAVFWFVVLKITITTLIQSIRYQHEMTLLIIFTSMNVLWDVIFSPFGAGMRFHWAIIFVLLALSLKMSAESREDKRKKGDLK